MRLVVQRYKRRTSILTAAVIAVFGIVMASCGDNPAVGGDAPSTAIQLPGVHNHAPGSDRPSKTKGTLAPTTAVATTTNAPPEGG
jgi:hypothetical protein